jgi:hypothetical protein
VSGRFEASSAESAVAFCLVVCPVGSFRDENTCVACPANSNTTGEGATNASACFCDPGYVRVEG